MYDFGKLGRLRDPTKIKVLTKIDKTGVIRYHDTYKMKWKANAHAAKMHSRTHFSNLVINIPDSVQSTEQFK